MANRLTAFLRPERWSFSLAYWRGRTPWDSGVVPPELQEIVEGRNGLPPGHALDIGCGTGTNSLYLARHGWQVVGIDFAGPAIKRANQKRRTAGILAGSVSFRQGDASQPESFQLGHDCSLFFDLGCLHTIPPARRSGYAAGIASHAEPAALFLLYGFAPRWLRGKVIGITTDEVLELFTPAFEIERIVPGKDTTRGVVSAWYWLRYRG
ncbi:MAG: class I SAM-dependent methyltransferase [Ktedonobacterales bacterium]